ncbi:MAG TPA: TPM domain-containing protein [Steroidobacteraceae bacterium]|nr:TPM domain-containing protein [Steroidobacteraceae bacterium]
MLARWLALPALSLLLFSSGVLAQVAVPPLRDPVTDLTGTLTPEQIATLDRQLREVQARKGNYMAILIVPTTQPETIEQYSLRVVETWKLERPGVNDGLLLLVAKQDRAVRIEVGYGLEGAVPDVLANRIVEQVIVPRFRSGDFFGGLTEALTRITALIEGEPLPEPTQGQRGAPRGDALGTALPLLLLVVFVGGGILRRMLGTFGGASVTAGVAAAIVWFLTSTLVIAIGAAVIAFVIALFGGGGGGGWTSPGRRGWGGLGSGWGGGFGGGGWGGGGGGGGGWGGGGSGGFGGGGASGRW